MATHFSIFDWRIPWSEETIHEITESDTTERLWASLVTQRLKRLPTMRKTWVRSLGREDPLEKENGNPLQYSCLENPMEGEAW